MKQLSWIITLPLLALGVTFAVNNRQRVVIDLWPLEATLTLPAFLIVLMAIFLGFLIGALIAWASGGRRRRVAAERRARIDELERELRQVKQKLAQQEEIARQETAARREAEQAAAKAEAPQPAMIGQQRA